jgi:hypothetical protein
MKFFLKIAAVCCCICMAQSGFAQFSKGDIVLGGYVSFGYTNGNGFQNALNIAPSGGYVIKDNLTAFLNLGYSSNSNKYDDNVYINSNTRLLERNSSSFRTSIGVERLWKMGGNFGFALRGGIGLESSASKQKIITYYPNTNTRLEESDNSQSSTYSVDLIPNLTYQLGDRFNMRLSLGYLGYYSGTTDTKTINTIGIINEGNSSSNGLTGNFSLSSITLGGYYIIQPKAKKAE